MLPFIDLDIKVEEGSEKYLNLLGQEEEIAAKNTVRDVDFIIQFVLDLTPYNSRKYCQMF